jgi:hypothetical protein
MTPLQILENGTSNQSKPFFVYLLCEHGRRECSLFAYFVYTCKQDSKGQTKIDHSFTGLYQSFERSHVHESFIPTSLPSYDYRVDRALFRINQQLEGKGPSEVAKPAKVPPPPHAQAGFLPPLPRLLLTSLPAAYKRTAWFSHRPLYTDLGRYA